MSATPGKSQITPDEVLGQEALKRGFLKPEQLREALGEQAREVSSGRPKPRPLLNILVSKGFLTTEQVTQLRGVGEPKSKQDGQRLVPKEEIARGGMGAILRAEDRDIRRNVAMKVMLDASDEKSVARFMEEAQVTGQLEHPNIVPVHALGRDGQGRPFFTMKLVKGQSLADVLKALREAPEKAKEYTLARLLGILTNVCNAIAFAHSKGVVHRDLKPANIMLGAFGECLVMDWGLAKVGAAKAKTGRWEGAEEANQSANQKLEDRVKSLRQETVGSRTLDGALLGTPHYMPPEQAAGEISKIDSRSDIYSLGAILYEILTLKPPVEGKTLHALLKNVVEGKITPPDQRAGERHVPRELVAVAMKALSREQGDRYQAVEDLRRDIELYLEGRAVSAKPDTAWETLVKLVRRNKGASLATAAALVVVTTLVAVGYWLNARERDRAAASEGTATREKTRAEAVLADFKAEQARRAGERKTSAPAFAEVARVAMNRGEFDHALLSANAALDCDPEVSAAWLTKAHALLAKGDYIGARSALQQHAQLKNPDPEALPLVELCGQAAREASPKTLIAIGDALRKQNSHGAAEVLYAAAAAATKSFEDLVRSYRARIDRHWPGLGNLLGDEGHGRLRFGGHALKVVTDLTPFAGMPLVRLDIALSGVSDLSPLRTMRLEHLNVEGTTVVDLAGLQGMRLRELNIASTKVRDLTPLRGMALIELNASHSEVDDLRPLGGMPLERLYIANCKVTDLAPLDGMPLLALNAESTQITDLHPLSEMKLTFLKIAGTKVTDLRPIRALPLKSLTMGGLRITDLSALREIRLETIDMNASAVNDLTHLSGMPLRYIVLNFTKVEDLSPLRDMPLTELCLFGISVSDLTPLEGMRLERIGINPEKIKKGMDILRRMESLRTIHIQGEEPRGAAEFWNRYDAGEFK